MLRFKLWCQRVYTTILLHILGRLLEAISRVDKEVQAEVANLPDDFSLEMKVLPGVGSMKVKKIKGNILKATNFTGKAQLTVGFKHLGHAFKVLSFQEGTARAFANNRLVVDGELADALKIVRCLNRAEVFALPKIVAERAVKRYPNISLAEKANQASKIYSQFVMTYLRSSDA